MERKKSEATPDDPAWWLQSLAEPQAERATDAAGLSSIEARARLAEFGPNLFRDHQEQPLWLQFLSRFKNPLVILLLVASAISALTRRNPQLSHHHGDGAVQCHAGFRPGAPRR